VLSLNAALGQQQPCSPAVRSALAVASQGERERQQAEGIRKFTEDIIKLEGLIAKKLG
jgi:hypothetical protein